LTRIWARRGTRPRAPRDQRYNWAYLFGAACPARAATAAIVVPEAHAAVLLDGAGYHKSHRLRVPANITLIPLPRHAPELNSAENIWEYLRKNKLANTVFENYDGIVEKACQAWLFFATDKPSVTTITNRDRASVI
jgi:hypothetical protein